MCSPIAKILERAMGRKRKIPWDKLETMIKTIQCPMYYEGFDNIYLIDTGMENENYDYKSLLKKCDIPQDNPYHYETLKEHIEKAAELTKEKRKKRSTPRVLPKPFSIHLNVLLKLEITVCKSAYR